MTVCKKFFGAPQGYPWRPEVIKRRREGYSHPVFSVPQSTNFVWQIFADCKHNRYITKIFGWNIAKKYWTLETCGAHSRPAYILSAVSTSMLPAHHIRSCPLQWRSRLFSAIPSRLAPPLLSWPRTVTTRPPLLLTLVAFSFPRAPFNLTQFVVLSGRAEPRVCWFVGLVWCLLVWFEPSRVFVVGPENDKVHWRGARDVGVTDTDTTVIQRWNRYKHRHQLES